MLKNKEMDSITFTLPKQEKEMLMNFFKDEVALGREENIDSALTYHLWNGVYLQNGMIPVPVLLNKQAQFWLAQLYSERATSSQVLSDIFAYNAEGINWQSKGLNLKPFIEYALEEQERFVNKDVDMEKAGYVLEQFRSIRNMSMFIEDNFSKSDPYRNANSQQDCVRKLDQFIEIFHNDEEIPFTKIYQFFLSQNDLVDQFTFTSRALMGLVEMQKGWRNDAESRLELVSLFHLLSKMN